MTPECVGCANNKKEQNRQAPPTKQILAKGFDAKQEVISAKRGHGFCFDLCERWYYAPASLDRARRVQGLRRTLPSEYSSTLTKRIVGTNHSVSPSVE